MLDRYMSQLVLDEDFMALSDAAAQALARLVPAHVARQGGEDALNLLATAISTLIPVYTRMSEGALARRLKETDLLSGRFEKGGARLVLCAGTECSPLVRHAEVAAAIDRIVQDYVGISKAQKAGRPL
jgi:hypothetical protein